MVKHDHGVTLRRVTADNWRFCIGLDVFDDQRSWLPPNVVSLAAAQFYPDNACRAVYVDDRLVGFAMYGVEQTTRRVKVFRLMVDRVEQRSGYGIRAMRLMLVEIAHRWPGSPVYVSFHEENAAARRLYERLGFIQVEQAGTKITACRMAVHEAAAKLV